MTRLSQVPARPYSRRNAPNYARALVGIGAMMLVAACGGTVTDSEPDPDSDAAAGNGGSGGVAVADQVVGDGPAVGKRRHHAQPHRVVEPDAVQEHKWHVGRAPGHDWGNAGITSSMNSWNERFWSSIEAP